MRYYFAPLEGITGYIYRRAHFQFYPGMDRYFVPFIVPKEKCDFSLRERLDILPENNTGMHAIPQILCNKSEEFLRLSKVLNEQYGYEEINLNVGCPSKTVVGKKRGAGFLSVPDRLEQFLYEVCAKKTVKLSIKTRIGITDADEYVKLLEIYKKYPLSELIVHPRLQTDFYKNQPDLLTFAKTFALDAPWDICYNGDIRRYKDAENILERFPKTNALMIGRGMLIRPDLVNELKLRESGCKKEDDEEREKAKRERRYRFHVQILEDYRRALSGEKPVLFKMKELWSYMSQDFTEYESYWKRMKKAQRLCDFELAVKALVHEQRIKD